MVFELSIQEKIFYALIVVGCGSLIAYLSERFLIWHRSRVITIQKRGDEFIELSHNYYMPLATLVGGIEAETDPEYGKARPKILFFKVAKYLNFYKCLSDAGVGFSFPKETQETKVAACSEIFFVAIQLLIFNDDKEAIERVINYYKKKSDLLSFIEDIEALPEYNTFKSIYNGKIQKKLFNYSHELRESIQDGVTEEYKVWYKKEFRKKHTEKNINKNANDKKEDTIKLYEEIYNKRDI